MLSQNLRSSGPSNLKTNSINRILKDMIQATKSESNATFLIIVVDDYTAKILSSFLSMSEVLNEGIFSVERLQTKRQKFPKYHALYFVSPTAETCEIISKDFEDEKSPQYSRVHIYFSHRVMEITLDKLVTQNLARRIKTCKELNLSFLIKDKNLFDLGMPLALKIFAAKNNDQKNSVISNIMERLLTVCAVIGEYPYIQYQKNSKLCLNLAETLNANLSEFYQTKVYNEKRGILLIVDRTIDVSTPILHDYNYETMVYDLFKTHENELEFNDKKYKLDEKDELWAKYKNKHMCLVFEELQKDFEAFMQSDLSKVNKSENLESFDEMANVLHNMKGYKAKTTQFGLHLKLAEEITTKYKQQNLYDVIELEQDIVTGVNANGDSVSNKDIFNKYAAIKNKISPKDNLRIITTLHTCLDITEKDFSVLANNLSNDEKKPIYNLESLGISFAKSKSKNARREPILNKNMINQFKMKSKSLEYNFLRSSPKMEGVVELCSKHELSRSEFPFVEEPKNLPNVRNKNYQISNNMFGGDGDDDEEMPKLIVFILGGVSHNEICAMERLVQERKINHHLIIGSTTILTANQLLDQLKDLCVSDEVALRVSTEPRNLEVSDIELTVRK